MSSFSNITMTTAGLDSSNVTMTTENSDVIDELLTRLENSEGLNTSIDCILVLVVIQTMLGLGCTLDLQLIQGHLLQPTGIAIASTCQFGIMPLVAFLAAKTFGLDKTSAIAVIVTGSCPGGNLSNILTFFLYGDMNLSILMSTTSTLLALIFMPLCIFIYGTNWIGIKEIGSFIPFGGIILTLFLTLFPVLLGLTIKRYSEKLANSIMKISLFGAMTAFIALMTLSCIVFGRLIFDAISPSCYFIAILMPLFGYALGYLAATTFGLPDASRRTVAVETGSQNSQLASTILKMAFASRHMGAYFLFPVYYAIFQGAEGLGFIIAFRIYRRYYNDLHLAPQSRVTYEKFDGDLDADLGAEHRVSERYYQQSLTSSDAEVGRSEQAKIIEDKKGDQSHLISDVDLGIGYGGTREDP